MNSRTGEQLKQFIKRIVEALVDYPEMVKVTVLESGTTVVLELSVAPDDVGKVIGRQGRTAQALRTLLTGVATKLRKRAVLQILEK